jgi:Peptidase MA superfamily
VPLGMQRQEAGRFTVVASERDAQLARSLLTAATANDSFPWLPRPRERVLIVIAPDRATFRELVGPSAPEYGAAIAFPDERRIVMQGSRAASDAGDPIQVLRHELAHLALHEALGDLAPRWFDEGYASLAAGEWGRDEVLATNVSLALRGMPSLEALDSAFQGGAARANAAYAMAYRAVAELAALDPQRGLTLFFQYWRQTGELDPAIRRAFNITQAAFEARWRSRTRRRYGALAVFADLTLAALVLLVIVAPLYVARRRRDHRRLVAMEHAEADADRRARQSAIEELLKSVAPPGAADGSGEITK